MKYRLSVLFIVLLAALLASCTGGAGSTPTSTVPGAATTPTAPAETEPTGETPAGEPQTLTVMTHDSFSASEGVIAAFEQDEAQIVVLSNFHEEVLAALAFRPAQMAQKHLDGEAAVGGRGFADHRFLKRIVAARFRTEMELLQPFSRTAHDACRVGETSQPVRTASSLG